MFNKEQLDDLFDELKIQYAMEPDWEQIVRDAHLGVARSDANVSLGDIDHRVVSAIGNYTGT